MASLTKVKFNNIDSSVTFVSDPTVLLNYESTLANTDIGFIFNRDGGISSNVALYWNETNDAITVAYTSNTGFSNGNISIIKYANVAADWYFGNLAGGTTDTVWISANVLPTANGFYNFGSPSRRWNVGYFAASTLDVGGSQISIDATNGFKFVVGGTGTPIYLSSNGAISSTSLSTATTATIGTDLIVGGNFNSTGFINTTGNVSAAVGQFGAVNSTGFINTGANISAATGVFGSLNSTGFINTAGNISAATGVFGAINSTGFFNTSANISAAAAFFGVINSTGYINTTANLLAAVGQFGSINSTGFVNTSGNISAAAGQFGSLNSTGLINTSSNIVAAAGSFGSIISTGLINTSANVSASMFNGGQLYVSGLVNAGGNILATGGIFNNLSVNGNIAVGSIAVPGEMHSIVGNISQSGAGTVWFNTPGNILAALGQFGEIRSSGLINTSANILAAVGNFGSVNSSGLINTSGNVSAAQLNAGQINTTGNILATAGVFNDLTVNGGITSTGFINTSGNVSAAVGSFGSVNSTGFINTSGNISAAILLAGQISTSGNLLSTGLRVFGNTTIGLSGVSGGQFHSIIGNITQSTSGGAVYINTSGNVLASQGSFGSIDSTGFINTSGNISTAQLNAGQINTTGNVIAVRFIGDGGLLTNIASVGGGSNYSNVNVAAYISDTGINTSANVLATAAIFNALTVNGNETVTGYLNVSGNILAQTAGVGGIEVTGIVYANSTAVTTTSTSGAVRIAGGAGIGGNTVIAGILTAGRTTGVNVANFTDTAGAFYGTANSWVQLGIQNASTGVGASTDFIAYANNGDNDTGWIDMGITGQNYVNQNGQYAITGPNDGYVFMSAPAGTTGGGNLVIATGDTGVYNDVVIATGGFDTIHEQARFIDGIGLKLIQGTSSINPTTGALIVEGGVGIGGNLNVQGDINLTGNLVLTGNAITFNTNNLSINDSLIYLADNNSGDVLDIGFIGAYTNPGYQHTGFVRDATDGTWKLFANVVPEPTTTVNFTDATYSNLRIGNLSAISAGFDGNVTAAYHIGTIGTAAQPLITSLGTLTSLTASGLINTSGNVLASTVAASFLTASTVAVGNISAQTIGNVGANIVGGFLNVSGNVLAAAVTTSNVFVNGNITTQNYFIGNGAFLTGIVSGGGTPGGGTNQIQFNQNGSFAGAASLYYYGANGAVVSNAGISSTSTTTGSFQISGGVGISENINAGGSITAGGFINTSGNVSGAVLTGGSVSVTGLINTSGNLLSTGLRVFGNASIGLAGAVSGQFHTVIGNITQSTSGGAVYINTSGNVMAAVGQFGSINSTGYINTSGNISTAQLNAGQINTTGNLLATAGVFNGLTVNGNQSVTGFLNVTGNVIGAIGNFNEIDLNGYLNSSGNVLATGGVFNALTVNGGITSTGFINTSGNVSAAVGQFGSINSTGFINTSGNVSAAVHTGGAVSVTGFINTSGNVSASQGSFGSVVSTGVINTAGNVLAAVGIFNRLDVNGNVDIGSITTPGAGHTIVGNVTQSGAGTIFYNTPGNILAAAGTFNGVTVNGIVSASNVTVAGNVTATYFIGNGAFLTGLVTGGPGGGFVYTVSVSPPVSSNPGDVWYDSGTDTIFQRINDGTNTVWVDVAGQPLNVNIGIVQGTSLSITGNGTVTGNLTVGNRLVGTSVQALYADLAEVYLSDQEYDPGVVLVFGGSSEVTESKTSHDPTIAGVVSTSPAYLMNSGTKGISVALTGRVPCWVKGPVNKGDRIVSSDVPGVAECLDMERYQPGCIIGKSLDTIEQDEIRKIEVVVGRL